MTTIFIRTLFFYIILTFMFKLMGKRQIGQMQITEFVTAVILSEAAALPITNNSIPISHGLIPLATLSSLEVISSYISSRSVPFRKFINGTPIVLVGRGEVVKKNLYKARVTLDEIFAEVRGHGYRGLEDIQYVILEQSGKMSVIPKGQNDRATPGDLGIDVPERGVSFPVIIDGVINTATLAEIPLTQKWLNDTLAKNNIDANNVLYMTVDDTGAVCIIRKPQLQK